jgi:Zn-dependent protease with chaperone function
VARPVSTSAYREPRETLVLGVTLLIVLGVIALTATATVCSSLLLVLLVLVISYASTRSHHESLLRKARQVNMDETPGVAQLIHDCEARLQPGPITVFVAPSRTLNAYTFGLSTPKVVVLYSSLLRVMDPDELRFIIGHEMGHVRLGHTWLNSLIGGMAGIPSPLFISTLLALAFRGWNRICEYSADRAGLLACGDAEKAISALVKLVAPQAGTSEKYMEQALRHIDAEDDDPINVINELLATHPMLIRRIEHLRRYAVTSEYRRLQGLVDRNLANIS